MCSTPTITSPPNRSNLVPSDNDSFRRTLTSLDAICAARDAELKRLCERGEVSDALQVLADDLIANLAYLFNYRSATSGLGGTVDITELHERLSKDVAKTFRRLT